MSFNLVSPYVQFLDDLGVPVENGSIRVYQNRTTNDKVIYSDDALTVPQDNPYTLDGSGRVIGDVKYTGLASIELFDEFGASIRTMDDVASLVSGAATNTTEGVVRLATNAETIAGTDTDTATTPLGITSRLASPGPIGSVLPGAIEGTSVSASGSVRVGSIGPGASGTKVLVLENGTVPTTSPQDTVQLFSTDLTAGNTMLSMRSEGTPLSTFTTQVGTMAFSLNGTTYYALVSSIAGNSYIFDSVQTKRLKETVVTLTSVGGVATIDFSAGSYFILTLTEDTTLAFTSVDALTVSGVTLKVIQDSTARTITYPAEVRTVAGSNPQPSSVDGDEGFFTFWTEDGLKVYLNNGGQGYAAIP